jgi:hypothetical protein
MRWHGTVGGSGTPGQFVNYVALYGHFIPRLFFFVKLDLGCVRFTPLKFETSSDIEQPSNSASNKTAIL